MIAEKSYVRVDGEGSMRVGNSRVSLDSVVIGFQQGEAPETIRRNFPTLTLEEVYGAITYYLANREEVDEHLRRQQERWDRAAQEQERNPSPAMRRLRTLKSIPEFRAATLDPLVTGAAREAAIEKFLSEVPNRLASGNLSADQAAALEEWRQIRQKNRQDEREKFRALVYSHLASQVPAEAKAEIDAALEALLLPAKSRDVRPTGAAE